MKARTWSIISLLCLLGAIYCWQLGEQKRLAPAAADTPTNSSPSDTSDLSGAAAKVSLLTRLSPRQLTSTLQPADLVAVETDEPVVPFRLANTALPLSQLIHQEKAVLLRNALIDTRTTTPVPIPDHLRAQGDPGAYIVQARSGVGRAFRDAIESVGGTIVAYIPNNALLVRADEQVASRLGSLALTHRVLPFEPYYKLSPALLESAATQQPLSEGSLLTVTGYPGEAAALRRDVEELGGNILGAGNNPVGPQLTVTMGTSSLPAIAGLRAVQLVEPSVPRAFMNDLTRVRLGVSTDTLVTNNHLGLTGSNLWVNLNDGGVDQDHPDLKGRVFGRANLLTDPAGHGTHVAGIIASSGENGPIETNLPPGSVEGANFRGMAPAVKLYVTEVDAIYGPVPSDASLIELAARTNYLTLQRTNALVSNNSWVYPRQYEYTTAAAAFDAATRDALPDETGSQAMLYVFSAGNAGGGNNDGSGGEPGSIAAPATAKNVISVGAFESLREILEGIVGTNEAGDLETNSLYLPVTDNDDEILAVSGRGNVGIGLEGPSGRFKPDVVAPGSFIVSTRSADWDTNAQPPSVFINTTPDQILPAGQSAFYSINVPPLVSMLTIETLTNRFSPVPFPFPQILLSRDPDSATPDHGGRGRLGVTDPEAGAWYYTIFNDSDRAITFDLRVRLDTLHEVSDAQKLLLRLNDPLGPHYRYLSGTSTSAGAISGMLALVQEFFERQLKRGYSPALLKGLLIHGARSLSPNYSFEVAPRINYQGWGLPQLPTVLPSALTNLDENLWPVRWLDQNPTNALPTGQTRSYEVTLPPEAGDSDLRVTLLWTDPPGNPAASVMLVNDLDLTVSRGDQALYIGNSIPTDSDYTPALGTNDVPVFDRVNNVENVFIRRPVGTNYTIRVNAHRVNVNAVTAHTNDIVQDFVLLVSTTTHTNALTLKPLTDVLVVTNLPTPMTNGVPLLQQRAGANSPLIGHPAGQSNQWHFYVFTNTFVPGVSLLTNGPYVAFATFLPPNLSVPRNLESDIDLYVTRSRNGAELAAGLLTLDPASLVAAQRSVERGGEELIAFDDGGEDEIFYVGVKAEDQMGSEYGLIGLSSVDPFEEQDDDGNLILRGLGVPLAIPDGSAVDPGGVQVMAVGISSVRIGRAVVTQTIAHEQAGDLLGDLSHAGAFAVLNNHAINDSTTGVVYTATYDDSGSGQIPLSRSSDGPGSLRDFLGLRNSGLWILTMVDNALSHTGFITNFEILVAPMPDLLLGVYGSVLANQFNYYVVDVPADATRLRILLSEMSGPLNVYLRRESPPTLDEYDKAAFLSPPSGELSLGIDDVPPLTAGTYYVGVYNPNAFTVDYFLRAAIDRDLTNLLRRESASTNLVLLKDDARTTLTNTITDDRVVTDIEVGLRVDHPRLSDLAFHLVSPRGSRALLVENRGGTNWAKLGYERVTTNFHHVALTYEAAGGRTALYLDGALQAQTNLGAFTPRTGLDLYLGHRPGSNEVAQQYLGDLDEVSLFNRALEPSEILGLFKFGGAGKPTNALVSLWSFEGSGADLMGRNPATVIGPAFVPGAFGTGLQFIAAGDAAVVSNSASLNVASGSGFSLDAWINPRDLSQPRPLALWSSGTNQYGVEFGILPGATNEPPGVLYANLVDLAGMSHFVTASSQGRFLTNGILTNIVYTTLLDNTNLALAPIKFATPDTGGGELFTNQFISGFEGVEARKLADFAANQSVDGWRVETNTVSVLNAPILAHTGTNLLMLQDGGISRALPTVAGRTYRIQWVHRRHPAFPDTVAWWPGETDATDVLGTHPGTERLGVAHEPAKVGSGFRFGAGSHVEVGDHPDLDATGAFAFEMWYRADAGAPLGGGLIGKRVDLPAPASVNYAAGLGPLGLDSWYDDPSINNPAFSDDAVGGRELARITPAPAAGVFHHLAGTYRQASASQVELNLYLDGELRRSRLMPGVLGLLANDQPLRFGVTSPGAEGFRGVIDELTFYRRALTVGEIQQIVALDAAGKGFPGAVPQSRVVIEGRVTNLFTSEIQWQTNAVTFIAQTNGSRLELTSVQPGMLFDSFELTQVSESRFLPEETLDSLLGETALGDWRLEVTDRRTGAIAPLPPALISWRLQLTYAPIAVSAVRLTNGIPYTNSIPAGSARYFVVDVPRSATRATNTFAANPALDLWFQQSGIPRFDSANDFRLLTNAAAGTAVLATNGVYQVDTNGVATGAPTAPPQLAPGQRYYLGITNAGGPSQYVVRVDFDALDTNMLGLTTLGFGQTIVTNIAVTNALQYYRYTVTTNATAASFEVYPTDGNVNLYLRKATRVLDPLPTSRVYDYASEQAGTNAEIIRVTQTSVVPLGVGDWYLGVLNVATNPVGYRVRVVETTNALEQFITLTNGVPRNDSVTPGLPVTRYFRFGVSNSPPAVEFDLANVTGPVTLIAKLDARPSPAFYDRLDLGAPGAPARMVVRTNDALPALDGEWLMAVVNETGGDVAFQIQALAPAPPRVEVLLVEGVGHRATVPADTFGLSEAPDYYRFRPAADATEMEVVLSPVNGNADLIVRRGFRPSLAEFDYLGNTPDLTPDVIVVSSDSAPVPLAPDDWYFGVVNQELVSVTYTILARQRRGSDVVINPSVGFVNGQLVFTWNAAPGLNFQVQYAEAIPPTGSINWFPIAGGVVYVNGVYTFTDPDPPTAFRIYRVIRLP